jgi:DNA invertase Pin-like site-specific DNA recombinase
MDQSLDVQLEQLRKAGAYKVFQEKQSGAKADNRKELAKALKALGEGDCLVVTRLDRLARSTLDLLQILDSISRKGATFKSIADAWADTSTPHGRLLVTVLGGIAEFERSLIKERTAEGIKRAKANGVHLGRPRKLNAYQVGQVRKMQREGLSNSEIGKLLGVSHQTVGRL